MVAERDVIIIGAGAAGLACAHRLRESSVDFLVLEAAERIGGRILTDYSLAGGAPAELGALFVHGKRASTHRWIQEFGLHQRRMPVTQRALFWRNGRAASLPTMALPFHPTVGLRAFVESVHGIPRAMARYAGPDLTLAEFLDRVKASPGARPLVTLLHAHASNADVDEIGVRGPAEEARLAGETFGYRNFQILEGYSELVARRMRGLEDRIRLKAQVTAVHRAASGVRIEALEDGRPVEFRAKRVVVTLPLGVLKADAVAFDPPLPASKLEAIRAIGFGSAVVVQMRLRGGNLVERLGDFTLLWGQGASTFHRPFFGLRGRPDVLGAFIVGREARRRASLADAELVEAVLQELEPILPAGVRPGAVESVSAGRWPNDPFVRGGYSFLPPGARVAHRRALAEPVEDRLFFAGEATHALGESATVHGAIETGYRAADEALASLRRERAIVGR